MMMVSTKSIYDYYIYSSFFFCILLLNLNLNHQKDDNNLPHDLHDIAYPIPHISTKRCSQLIVLIVYDCFQQVSVES